MARYHNGCGAGCGEFPSKLGRGEFFWIFIPKYGVEKLASMSAQSFCLSCTRVHECFSSENYGADNTKPKRVLSKRDGIRSGNPSPSPHQFDVCRASNRYTCLQYSVLDPKLRNSAVPLIGSLSCSDKAKINKNLCGRDGRTICGPQRVPKSTCVSL